MHSCDEVSKDAEHILHCPQSDRVDSWLVAVKGLEEWMTMVDTNPAIIYCIITAMWTRNTNTLFQAYIISPHIQIVAEEQDKIGWKQFMKG